jgi:formate-dependent nitrite reductase membrane component NrfD
MNVPILVTALAAAVLLVAFAALIIKSRSKSRTRAHIAAGVTIIVISLPIAFWSTIMLLPLWGWIEDRYGIESVGHSGPADWCFSVVFLIVIVILTGLYMYAFRRVDEH